MRTLILAVDVFDVASGQWSKGPDLPEGRHRGFGCTAAALDGRIYANTFQGDLLRLSNDEQSWEVVGRLRHPRIAHRLVATPFSRLIALGGEDGRDKRPDLEWLTPNSTAQGFLRFDAKVSGLYLLTVAHHREPIPGFHLGRPYEQTSHNASFTWIQR